MLPFYELFAYIIFLRPYHVELFTTSYIIVLDEIMGGCTLSKLPILPLPQLETTHKELLTWIKPLLTEDEFIQSKKEIDAFFKKMK